MGKLVIKAVMKNLCTIFIIVFLVYAPIIASADNPAPITEFITVTVTVPAPEAPPTPPLEPIPSPGGGGGPMYPPAPSPASILLTGYTSPRAFIAVLKDGRIASTFRAETDGAFSQKISGLYPKIYTWSIYAIDTDDRQTRLIYFTVNLQKGALTTVKDIFLPPTISISPQNPRRGDKLKIFGQTHPSSFVIAIIQPGFTKLEIKSDWQGQWQNPHDTSRMFEGDYNLRAQSQLVWGLKSPESEAILFTLFPRGITLCEGPDINGDKIVNLTDFSILMYWWEKLKIGNPCADINNDGSVNLVDFSIMMYWWEKPPPYTK